MDLPLDDDRAGQGEQALSTVDVCRADELTDSQIEDLAAVLVGVVQAGASVGFVPPLSTEEALVYWRQAVGPSVVLDAAGTLRGTTFYYEALAAS